MKIILGCDHAGFPLKEKICLYLNSINREYEDSGVFSEERANWVEIGARVAKRVSLDQDHILGILVCGSGIGMSIVANRFPGVRAALCHDEYTAGMSRSHNNANILCLGARILDEERALAIVDCWMKTVFEGGRHAERLSTLNKKVEPEVFDIYKRNFRRNHDGER